MDMMDIAIQGLQIITILVIGAGGSYFLVAKKKIGEFRRLIDAIDDAVYDDKISEVEFRTIYEHAKELLKK